MSSVSNDTHFGFYRGPPRRTDYRIDIKNLSTRVSWQVTTFTCSLAGY